MSAVRDARGVRGADEGQHGKDGEAMKEPKYVVFDKREGLFENIMKNVVTFSFILLCIYVSRGSTWWTFATGCFFLLMLFGLFARAWDRNKKFHSKAELKEWVDALEEE